MRSHLGGGKMLPLYDLMLSEVDCVLANAMQVKQKESAAHTSSSTAVVEMFTVISNLLLREGYVDAEVL